jgi:acyl-CoA thioester hydrolase
MFQSETLLRVRYAETDQMGFAYYGYYSMYYEVARVESLRQLGMSYKELESLGVMLPVLENNSRYFSPARYDDELRIVTYVREKPGVRLFFEYDFFNSDGKLIHHGETRLAFVERKTGRPCRPPQEFMKLIAPYFEERGSAVEEKKYGV